MSMDEKETGRLEAFSDGVFAVAITLLVLNIMIQPENSLLPDGDLFNKLFTEWPHLAAYVMSFFTVGVMWLNHRRLFVHIKRIDSVLLLLNIFLLLIIVFIPVPTALLAKYLIDPNYHAAVVIYTGTYLFMALGFNALWYYAAYQNRLLGKDVDMEVVTAISRQYPLGPLLYVIAFLVAWVSSPVSIALTVLIALFFALPSRLAFPGSARKTGRGIVASVDEPRGEDEL